MSLLAFGMTWTALALTATWIFGAALLSAWRVASRVVQSAPRLRASLARGVPLVLLVPPILGSAASLAVSWPTGKGCHCMLDAALHLCAVHPERALALLPAALLVLGAFALRIVPHACGLVRRARLSLSLAPGRRVFTRVSEPVGNAFSLALPRPRIVVDGKWWSGLSSSERRIVLAHEGAHLRRGDPILLELCGLLSRLLPERLAGALMRAWRDHAEQQADAAAARSVGDSLAVASLLVDLHRRALPSAPGLAIDDGRGLEARVRALLDGSTTLRAGSDLGLGGGAVLAILFALPVPFAERIHHALEAALRVFT